MFRRRVTPLPPLPVLAELRDVDSPAAARRAGVEFGRERRFAADLLRVRPWLEVDTAGRDVPALLLQSEWIGFLGLLDERGPWVYVQNVREVQVLSRLYSRLAGAAGARGDGLGVEASAQLAALETEFWEVAASFAAEQRGRWAAQRRENK